MLQSFQENNVQFLLHSMHIVCSVCSSLQHCLLVCRVPVMGCLWMSELTCIQDTSFHECRKHPSFPLKEHNRSFLTQMSYKRPMVGLYRNIKPLAWISVRFSSTTLHWVKSLYFGFCDSRCQAKMHLFPHPSPVNSSQNSVGLS